MGSARENISIWEAYKNLFKEIETRREWKRERLIEALNKHAGDNHFNGCTYSRRALDGYLSPSKPRRPEPYRLKHIHAFLTEQLRDLKLLEKFQLELATVAPPPPKQHGPISATSSGDDNPPQICIAHNLPDRPSLFLDRNLKSLRHELEDALAHNGMIVLHDLGGAGKTTIAIQVARDGFEKGLFPGGAAWVNCEMNASGESCASKISQILAIDLAVDNVEPLRSRPHILIVFDNFESAVLDDTANRFLRSLEKVAAVLITTKVKHPGLDDFVRHVPVFDDRDALDLFLFESKLTEVSSDERETISRIYDSVGKLPLAIVLLARRAKLTTLTKLESELKANFDILATDDRLLEPRQRSMAACFSTCFNPLTAEARETLFKLSVAANGIHKVFVDLYLEQSHWIPALETCVNSGLLTLDQAQARYKLHPLVRHYLADKMGTQKSEWQYHFVRFFCKELEEVASTAFCKWGDLPIIASEAENCRAALKQAGETRSFEHFLVVDALSDDAWEWSHEYGKRSGSEEFEFLQAALRKARNENDKEQEERISFPLLKLYDEIMMAQKPRFQLDSYMNGILRRLKILNPDRAEAVRSDLEAYCFARSGQSSQAEISLERSVLAWSKAGARFVHHAEAAQVNLFRVLGAQRKVDRALQVAERLWQVIDDGCHCLLYTACEGEPYWAEPITDLSFYTQPALRNHSKLQIIWAIASDLVRFHQWLQALPWLRLGQPLARQDHFWESFGATGLLSLKLGETYLNLGDEEKAVAAYIDAAEASGSAAQAEAHFALGKIAANRGQFQSAINMGRLALELNKAALDRLRLMLDKDEMEQAGLTEPDDSGPKIRMLISTWEGLAAKQAAENKKKKGRGRS